MTTLFLISQLFLAFSNKLYEINTNVLNCFIVNFDDSPSTAATQHLWCADKHINEFPFKRRHSIVFLINCQHRSREHTRTCIQEGHNEIVTGNCLVSVIGKFRTIFGKFIVQSLLYISFHQFSCGSFTHWLMITVNLNVRMRSIVPTLNMNHMKNRPHRLMTGQDFAEYAAGQVTGLDPTETIQSIQ